jgi:hypothetical protein
LAGRILVKIKPIPTVVEKEVDEKPGVAVEFNA